jgi:ABC-type multidrug transport system ATPase subunit
MKILKIKVSGFKLLEDNFELDFLNKARVSINDKEDEIIELLENLYMPTTTVFTGKNSSGKSTVLSLIEFINEILYKGRVKYKKMDFRINNINLELFFLLEETMYKYTGTILIPKKNILDETSYCDFSNEKLYSKKYYKSYGKNILEAEFDINENYNSNVADTSILYKLTSNKHYMFNTNEWLKVAKISSIFYLFETFGVNEKLMLKIMNLFDDSVSEFKYDKERKLYSIHLKGLGAKTYSETDINELLSDGTKKGLLMFALTIAMLKFGGSLIIDEIENSFHKNLVENIIMIFNDKRINKNKANLIFSTHYIEILDIFRRRDNIYIMDKKEFITICNLHEDYDERTDLSKSNQFNNNTFKTLINYEKLMDLKKELINEISDSSRG